MISWNEYWQNYSTSKAEFWMIGERDNILNKYLDLIDKPVKKVLEVGCGFGSNIKLLKNKRSDVEVYTLDNSQVAIDKIKEEIPYSYLGDCRDTAFEDNQFDLVYSAGLMEHFRDELPFVNEMKRITNDQGYLVTFVPAKYSLWQLYQLLHFGKWQHGYEKAYSYNSLKNLFVKNNFKIIEMSGIDPFSVNGFIMKLANTSYDPFFKKSFLKSGYTELCVVTQNK
ncbi:MAG: class I SAM-dependent methyltransferase [Melioribacteraceae bacterium]|nr:MAG: class I SAM-dependent methyltransferase [Melioribacteraceae bacterium]